MWNQIVKSLIKVFNDEGYLNLVVSSVINANQFDDHQRKIFTKIVYGVVENKILIDYLTTPLTSGKRLKPYLRNSLRVGIYAISFMNLSNHYVVNQIVEIVRKKDFNASKLINKVLRDYIREDYYNKQMSNLKSYAYLERLSIQYSMPIDILEIIAKQYPNQVETIIQPSQSNINTFRINFLKANPKFLVKQLAEQGIEWDGKKNYFQTSQSLIDSEIFKKGYIIAQDLSSIKVGDFCAPKRDSHILDVCSAPGSKAMHLADLISNNGEIIACDIFEHKLELIKNNAEKLGVSCLKTLLADGRNYQYNRLFDLVLVDAPCSGLGVISHKPDLKYRLSNNKINEIITIQKEILDNVSNYVVEDGILVYSTCTINKHENEEIIKQFLKNNQNFVLIEQQLFLNSSLHDGFYMCKMKRINIRRS